jgi:hypothetical protein
MLVTAILESANANILSRAEFSLPGDAWTLLSIVTYPFVGLMSFFTPLGIFCFYCWAVGIETHLGRRVIATLLILLVLTPVAVGAFWWYVLHQPAGAGGNYLLVAGLLTAFGTLYPNAEWRAWVPFKYIVFACLLCGSMMELAKHHWFTLACLWASAFVGFAYVRHAIDQEYDDHVPLAARIRSWFRSKPKFRVVPRIRDADAMRAREESDGDELSSDVDELLEKIARKGLSSLSAGERARLEQARENLLKKEQK